MQEQLSKETRWLFSDFFKNLNEVEKLGHLLTLWQISNAMNESRDMKGRKEGAARIKKNYILPVRTFSFKTIRAPQELCALGTGHQKAWVQKKPWWVWIMHSSEILWMKCCYHLLEPIKKSFRFLFLFSEFSWYL